jgi:hypothetical protein
MQHGAKPKQLNGAAGTNALQWRTSVHRIMMVPLMGNKSGADL